jgi:hypothetical protein
MLHEARPRDGVGRIVGDGLEGVPKGTAVLERVVDRRGGHRLGRSLRMTRSGRKQLNASVGAVVPDTPTAASTASRAAAVRRTSGTISLLRGSPPPLRA